MFAEDGKEPRSEEQIEEANFVTTTTNLTADEAPYSHDGPDGFDPDEDDEEVNEDGSEKPRAMDPEMKSKIDEYDAIRDELRKKDAHFHGPTMVLAPLNALGVWEPDMLTYFPHFRIQVLHGSGGKQRKGQTNKFVGNLEDLKRAVRMANPLDPKSSQVVYLTTYATAQRRYVAVNPHGPNNQVWRVKGDSKGIEPGILKKLGLSKTRIESLTSEPYRDPSNEYHYTYTNHLRDVPFNFLIVDEAHQISGRFSRSHHFAQTIGAARVIAAIATPFSNGVSDLSGFLSVLAGRMAKKDTGEEAKELSMDDSLALFDVSNDILDQVDFYWDAMGKEHDAEELAAAVFKVLDPNQFARIMEKHSLNAVVTARVLPSILKAVQLRRVYGNKIQMQNPEREIVIGEDVPPLEYNTVEVAIDNASYRMAFERVHRQRLGEPGEFIMPTKSTESGLRNAQQASLLQSRSSAHSVEGLPDMFTFACK